METEYKILNLYKLKNYDACLTLCAEYLQNKQDRMVEFIHMRSQTILSKTAGNGYDEVGYGAQTQDELVSTSIAKSARPGTSFQRGTVQTSQVINRNQTSTATTIRRQAVTGMGTSRARSSRTALRTASKASRAATAIVGGASFSGEIQLTMTMLSRRDKLFTASAKTLFEYILYSEGDVRKAIDIGLQADSAENGTDWWWDFALAKCYLMLGMYRTAEDCLRKALKRHKHIGIYLRLIAMYVELNQPISALEICRQGLSIFHEDTSLLMEQGRIHDEVGNSTLAIQDFRRVALEDPTNLEATANIALYNFYNDQPEIALRYYRRLLTTSAPSAEIYNNLGLCCLHCNQWDLILPCFRQALYFAIEHNTKADIWFNIAHVALSTGDIGLARRSLQVALAMSSEHEAARNALKAIENHPTINKKP